MRISICQPAAMLYLENKYRGVTAAMRDIYAVTHVTVGSDLTSIVKVALAPTNSGKQELTCNVIATQPQLEIK